MKSFSDDQKDCVFTAIVLHNKHTTQYSFYNPRSW